MFQHRLRGRYINTTYTLYHKVYQVIMLGFECQGSLGTSNSSHARAVRFVSHSPTLARTVGPRVSLTSLLPNPDLVSVPYVVQPRPLTA